MSASEFSDRSQQVLRALVQRYIREGQPVGSRALVQDAALPVSPATMRNIMADLEERGFICSPHTSAGRVPTSRGYRFFVDSLLQVQPLPGEDEASLRAELSPDRSAQELVETASNLLSAITGQAGLVTLPHQEDASLRQVEFLPLSGCRVLVILVCNEREVQNRIIHTQRPFTRRELMRAAHYINRHFAGMDLAAVRRRLLDSMRGDQLRMGELMQSIAGAVAQAFEAPPAPQDFVLAGHGNLLAADQADVERLRRLFSAFQKKQNILHLLDRSAASDGVKIFIGEEAGFEGVDDYSLITAPYQVGGRPLGVLGVIGPTRMAYERVIPVVDITARMLSLALASP